MTVPFHTFHRTPPLVPTPLVPTGTSSYLGTQVPVIGSDYPGIVTKSWYHNIALPHRLPVGKSTAVLVGT